MESNDDVLMKVSITEELIILAKINYEIIKTLEGDYLAIPKTGPRVSRPLHGLDNTLADDIMRMYREKRHKIPSERAVKDAIRVLISEANTRDAVKAYFRCAQLENEIFIDLGDRTGEVIHIFPGGWKVIEQAPVIFRRTALTSEFPRPVDDGDISKLFSIINVSKESEGLILGFLICAFFESIPKPILAVNGEQGSGKSDTSRRIRFLIDPSTAPLQSAPRDESSWVDLAAGCYLVSLDNLSEMPHWLSDSLCRAATGIGSSKRRLFSDKEIVVHQFKRVVILNGINLTALRGDLADRIIPITAPVISTRERKLEADLESAWLREFPEIFGALLTICSKVLEKYTHIEMDELPRMADFGRILKAIDVVRGTDSLKSYMDEVGDMAHNTLEGDEFFKSVARVVGVSWTGTATELLEKVNSATSSYIFAPSWPQTSRDVTERLARTGPTLRKAGWTIENLGNKNKQKTVRYHICPPAGLAGLAGVISNQNTKVVVNGRWEF